MASLIGTVRSVAAGGLAATRDGDVAVPFGTLNTVLDTPVSSGPPVRRETAG